MIFWFFLELTLCCSVTIMMRLLLQESYLWVLICLFAKEGSTQTQTNIDNTKHIYKIDRWQNYRKQQHQRINYLRNQRTLKFAKNTTETNTEAWANTTRVKQCIHSRTQSFRYAAMEHTCWSINTTKLEINMHQLCGAMQYRQAMCNVM